MRYIPHAAHIPHTPHIWCSGASGPRFECNMCMVSVVCVVWMRMCDLTWTWLRFEFVLTSFWLDHDLALISFALGFDFVSIKFDWVLTPALLRFDMVQLGLDLMLSLFWICLDLVSTSFCLGLDKAQGPGPHQNHRSLAAVYTTIQSIFHHPKHLFSLMESIVTMRLYTKYFLLDFVFAWI